MCIYVDMYVCMYICVYVYMYICICVCVYTCTSKAISPRRDRNTSFECSVLHVRCSALQCVAVRRSALQCVAVRCSALHACCSVSHRYQSRRVSCAVCCMCVACVLHVCCMCVACVLHVCCMCVGVLHVCCERYSSRLIFRLQESGAQTCKVQAIETSRGKE